MIPKVTNTVIRLKERVVNNAWIWSVWFGKTHWNWNCCWCDYSYRIKDKVIKASRDKTCEHLNSSFPDCDIGLNWKTSSLLLFWNFISFICINFTGYCMCFGSDIYHVKCVNYLHVGLSCISCILQVFLGCLMSSIWNLPEWIKTALFNTKLISFRCEDREKDNKKRKKESGQTRGGGRFV